MKEIVDLFYLGGRMPFESKAGIRFAHPHPVIGHADQGFAGILNEEPDLGSAGIHCILQQLFHCTGRPLDHFARRYLISDVIGQ